MEKLYDEVSIFDNKLISTTIIHLFLMSCKNMLVSSNSLLYGYNGSLNTVCLVIFCLLYLRLFLFSPYLKRIPRKAYSVFVFFLLFIAITFVFDPIRFTSSVFPYNYVRIQARTYIAYCLPLFFAFATIQNIDLFLNKIYKYMVIPFLVACASFVLSIFYPLQVYSISFGYALVFPCIASFMCFSRTRKRWFGVQALLCVVMITGIGSRGPLVSVAVGAFIILFSEKTSLKKIVVLLVCSLVTIIVFFAYKDILIFVDTVFQRWGISSRTIRLFLSENITYDAGRSVYHESLLKELNKHWLFGLGAFGGESVVGLAHGFYLDILANFGYIGGGAFILFLIFRPMKLYLYNRGSAMADFLLILMILIYPIGFFSEELWSYKEIWMILGLIINNQYRLNTSRKNAEFMR